MSSRHGPLRDHQRRLPPHPRARGHPECARGPRRDGRGRGALRFLGRTRDGGGDSRFDVRLHQRSRAFGCAGSPSRWRATASSSASLARLNPAGVPGNALWLQAVWASLLVLTGTYSQLLKYVISADLLLYVLLVAAVVVLRRRRPEWPRPFRAPLYPLAAGRATRPSELVAHRPAARGQPGNDVAGLRAARVGCAGVSCGSATARVRLPPPISFPVREDATLLE